MLRAALVLCLCLASVESMAGTNAAKLRRPLHRGGFHSGTFGSTRTAVSLDDALAEVTRTKKAVTRSIVLQTMADGQRYKDLPVDMLIKLCVESSSVTDDIDECFLPGETEADGWGM